MSKLPDTTNDLWMKPRVGNVNNSDQFWFEPHKVRRDTLERFMKLSICKNIKLNGNYTNHSIHATVFTTLDNAGLKLDTSSNYHLTKVNPQSKSMQGSAQKINANKCSNHYLKQWMYLQNMPKIRFQHPTKHLQYPEQPPQL